jgi:hypothetical protein
MRYGKLFMGESILRQSPVYFKGDTQVISEPKAVPAPSAEETRAMQLANDYNQYIYQQAKPMFDIGTAGFYKGADIQPDYAGMNQNYQTQMQGVQQGMNGLLQGNDLLAKQRQAAMTNQINGMTGGFRNWLAKSGLSTEGTTAGTALQNLGKGMTSAYQDAYNKDMAISSQLLEQQRQTALSPITDSAAIQQASIAVPQNIMALATGQAAPNTNMFNTLYSGRMSLASDPAAIHKQDATPGMIGSLGSAAIMCFPAGVEVDVPGGKLTIERTLKGMVVTTPDGEGKVIATDGPHMQPIIRVVAANGMSVETTATQPFLTNKGIKIPVVGDAVYTRDGMATITAVEDTGRVEDVYDITIDGDNIFYANGFAVEGGFE